MTSTIALPASLSETDVRTCEACWRAPVGAVRTDTDGRALLCVPCARAGYPRRVDLFPPFGMYKLTSRLVKMSDGKHGSGPASPPNPGPALPSPPPAPSPPGPPPV
jgi:hypothetical protein